MQLGPIGYPGAAPAEEHLMPLVNVTLDAGVFTEKRKHDLAARLTDVIVAFQGSEAFREVTWVLIEEIDADG
jgi:4-oxalocrotonate tautomerase